MHRRFRIVYSYQLPRSCPKTQFFPICVLIRTFFVNIVEWPLLKWYCRISWFDLFMPALAQTLFMFIFTAYEYDLLIWIYYIAMFSSRAPSNPNGPEYSYLPQMDTRMTSRFKYTGPHTNIFGVDLSSPLGRAFFAPNNIDIIRSELYSRVVLQLKGELGRTPIFQPRESYIQKKCHELYPLYAPIVHKMDAITIPAQVRELNFILIPLLIPNYISEIKGNIRYLKSLEEMPISSAMPKYPENASNRELVNRSMRMGGGEERTPPSSQNSRVQIGQHFHALPYNPWLASRMPRLYGK